MTLPAVHQSAGLLLGYPDAEWPARLALVSDCLAQFSGPGTRPLLRFCAAVRDTSVLELAERYVLTFDRSRRRTLHLTYYTDGDTRRRGASLADWKAGYRARGWEPPEDELPDYLPLALEFAARCPEPGTGLLQEHRAGLELLRMALADFGSPYADVLLAVCETLPGPSPADRAAALRLARSGPPVELVGLAPFSLSSSALPATSAPGDQQPGGFGR
ncbi:nitrate reductase molybdenum cofactor assembly chaperone [Streptomyces sp. NPDC096310]|uniref:nitrate reductase molybdenum cofactor assembly chaperone n=1 Tax=Streptomyces sp. NPDC096310 TaxID=3366082 RepID=UPI00380E6BA2